MKEETWFEALAEHCIGEMRTTHRLTTGGNGGRRTGWGDHGADLARDKYFFHFFFGQHTHVHKENKFGDATSLPLTPFQNLAGPAVVPWWRPQRTSHNPFAPVCRFLIFVGDIKRNRFRKPDNAIHFLLAFTSYCSIVGCSGRRGNLRASQSADLIPPSPYTHTLPCHQTATATKRGSNPTWGQRRDPPPPSGQPTPICATQIAVRGGSRVGHVPRRRSPAAGHRLW